MKMFSVSATSEPVEKPVAIRCGLSRLKDVTAIAIETPNGLMPEAKNGRLNLHLYDVIDDIYGTGPTMLAAALQNEGNPLPVNLYINSPGGDVWDARAMQNLLKRHEPGVTAYVDGLCASAATTVSLGAKEIHVAEGTRYMVHNAWTVAIGDHALLSKESELCAQIDDDIANDYASKTGKSLKEVKRWMNDETFFSAQDAVNNGLADSIVNRPKSNRRIDAADVERMRAIAFALHKSKTQQ